MMANQDSYAVLEDVVRQTFATVVWSHKIQEKQADIEANIYHWMEVANIFCASLTSAGVISSIFTDKVWLKIITALISFVTVFCGAYFKSFKVQDTIAKHRATAHKLVAIRNKLVALLADIRLQNGNAAILSDTHKALMNELHVVYAEAPATTDSAVKKASEALIDKQDYTFSDEEIDRFLPAQLRKEVTE